MSDYVGLGTEMRDRCLGRPWNAGEFARYVKGHLGESGTAALFCDEQIARIERAVGRKVITTPEKIGVIVFQRIGSADHAIAIEATRALTQREREARK